MGNWLYQTDRFLQINSPLGKDELILTSVSGQEGISELFEFTLHLKSANTNIMPKDLLGKPVSIKLMPSLSDEPRYFHGNIFGFTGGNIKEGVRDYRAIIKPWLWFLSYTNDCRIFQNKSVIDIIRQIFSDYNFSDFEFSGLKESYKVRDYCVQYHETALNFIQRLLEEEGIFYSIRHEANKHVVVFGDHSAAFKRIKDAEVVYSNGSYNSHCVKHWHHGYAFYSGKVSQSDYNYETSDVTLLGKQASIAKLYAAQKYELYHYPGGHQDSDEAKQIAQQRFNAIECNHDVCVGEGNYTSFTAGGRFSLLNAPNKADCGDYIISHVDHFISDSSYSQSGQGGQVYNNRFRCLPATVNYKPIQISPKPRVLGTQTAIVVGPSGQEIYTDNQGRVKIQFHWDRLGEKNEYSSCWVRVAQMWAGKNWGTLFLPRVGQEVIVQFINGDPDKPLIIGSVYNSSNLPPYELPFEHTQSGIKTRSTKDAPASSANEFRFDDKLGAEEIFIQAQKDFNQNVKNNLQVYVGNQCTLEAVQSIELKVGENKLLINTAGIYFNGIEVKVNN